MEERMLLGKIMAERLVNLVNSDLEVGGYFIAEVTPQGIILYQGDVDCGGKTQVSLNNNSFQKYMGAYLAYPDQTQVVLMHTHNCKWGEKVLPYNPYWSVNPDMDSLRFERGTVVNGFYISKKFNSSCDNGVAESVHKEYSLDYHLFVHPRHNSEGAIMTPGLVEITSYIYDAGSFSRVREIPTSVIEGKNV